MILEIHAQDPHAHGVRFVVSKLDTHADFVYSRQHILDAVWGEDRYLDERTINTRVRRLRNKLEAASADVEFVSVRGVGYMFL